MARPKKTRFCRRYDADRIYKPRGIPLGEIQTSVLSLDQFEALRLCDVEQLDQYQAGLIMGVSRATVQRLVHSGRKKIIEAIINNDAIAVNLRESEGCHVGMHSHQRKHRSGRHRI
ncbi:MAG: DUF134 domain-containing protein [Candidatus Zixiibacteriota bacterium]